MSKHTFISKAGLCIGAGALVLLVAGAGLWAQNFNTSADRKGCASILTDYEREKCEDVQEKKNEACNEKKTCDVGRQKRTIDEYEKAKKRLEDGAVNDSDKDRLRDKIRELKDRLDQRRDDAIDGIEIATRCIEARDDVQEWFEDVAIPLTKKLRDEAVREREDLLDDLEEAQKRVREAKEKRDAKSDDSNLRYEWEKATEALREVEKRLETFNRKVGGGKDIEYNANRLIRQYEDEKNNHNDGPTKEARNRLEKCNKLKDLRY